ncbi:MAG TPA: sigma factor [Phycisphaerae bacterium]|nr:sigma factor [Phycisphaerae bacterium]HRY68666.1 sigma factor [Phycisphaerae bacterium]HSA25492.1 sigma factor [Phycisphaerae bacterium]
MSETLDNEIVGGESILTDEQSDLVTRNLGLIGVHLVRHVRTPRCAKRERERDDLFQEGALALVRAALTYEADQHGAFAPYALFRIRGAIYRALHEYFTTIRVPTRVLKLTQQASDEPRSAIPRVQELPYAVAVKIEARPAISAGDETIRHRVRRRFERAVRAALAELGRRTWRHRNPCSIMERLAAERMLIAVEAERTPLRQIARESCISTGRACAYENLLHETVRRHFVEDPQLPLLVSMAGHGDQGFDTLLDASQQTLLVRVELDAFRSRFLGLSRTDQAEAILALIERAGGSMTEIACNLYRLAAGQDGICAVA